MNFLGGLIKNKIEKIYKASPTEVEDPNCSNRLDFEDIQHTLNVLQEENKILKSKVRILENSIFDDKSNTSQNKSASSSQFGNFFKEIKSTILYNVEDEPRDNLHEFKKFLYDNMLLHGSIDEDEAEILNTLQLADSDWEKKKEVYLFKQRVLEKNYTEMFKNVLVSNQLNVYLKSKGVAVDQNNPRVDKKDTLRESQKDLNELKESVNKYTSVSNEKYETNSIKIETKGKLGDQNVRDTMSLSNIVSPVNNPSNKDKPNDMEHKLLSDLVIVDSKDEDFFSKNPYEKDRLTAGSNSSKVSNSNAQATPSKSSIVFSSRKSVLPQASNERLKDDFDIASLLSDNNLANSINITDIKDVNRAGYKIEDKTQQEPNITNQANSLKISTKSTVIPNLSHKNKSEGRHSLFQFDMDEEDSFNFGSLIKTENDTEKAVTTNTKNSLNNLSISNKKESENGFKTNANIFEQLLNPESSKAVSSSKNVNAKKSQWDDDEDEEDMRDSYV